jgi:hypothetical protein
MLLSGIQRTDRQASPKELWIPAFAGMTLPFDAIAAKVVEVPFK